MTGRPAATKIDLPTWHHLSKSLCVYYSEASVSLSSCRQLISATLSGQIMTGKVSLQRECILCISKI